MKAPLFAFILAENVGNQLRRLLRVWRAAADLLSNWLLGLFEVQPATPTHFGTTASIHQTRCEPDQETADVAAPQEPRSEEPPPRQSHSPLSYSLLSRCFGTFPPPMTNVNPRPSSLQSEELIWIRGAAGETTNARGA